MDESPNEGRDRDRAGSGVGKATAMALLREGYAVVLAGRRAEALEQVADEAEKLGGQALTVPTDVTDPASVRGLVRQVERGVRPARPALQQCRDRRTGRAVEELAFEQWQAVVQTNLTGAFLCTQEAFRIMKSQTRAAPYHQQRLDLSADPPRPNSRRIPPQNRTISDLTKSLSENCHVTQDAGTGELDEGQPVG